MYVLYLLHVGPNYKIRYHIKLNCQNIFMAVFIELWPLYSSLNLAKINHSSEVTLLWNFKYGGFQKAGFLNKIHIFILTPSPSFALLGLKQNNNDFELPSIVVPHPLTTPSFPFFSGAKDGSGRQAGPTSSLKVNDFFNFRIFAETFQPWNF